MDVAGAPVELEDPGRDPVEHVAVVGDEDQAAPERGQPLLEPGDGVDVEVVGRLVEHQQVALGRPSVRASATRLAWPPDSVVDVGVERSAPMPSRSSTAAASQLVAPTASPRPVPGVEHRVLVERGAIRARRAARPRRTVPPLGLGRAGEHPQQRRLAACR